MSSFNLSDCPMGKETIYPKEYAPEVLFAIPRQWCREKTFAQDLHLLKKMPDFLGVDLWNGYEFCWIDKKTKNINFKFLKLVIPSDSPFLVESKSLKLYLFSLAHLEKTQEEMEVLIKGDLEKIVQRKCGVFICHEKDSVFTSALSSYEGIALDSLDLMEGQEEILTYQLDPSLLKKKNNNHHNGTAEREGENSFEEVKESLWTARFKSNCLVTGKPDWAHVKIDYVGEKIDAQKLYRYLISFRDHMGIHEQCVERIFVDLRENFSLKKLLVQGYFTRRGGLDINPIRCWNWDLSLGRGSWPERHLFQ